MWSYLFVKFIDLDMLTILYSEDEYNIKIFYTNLTGISQNGNMSIFL